MGVSDRIKGSLLGGAVGDALGFAVEFLEDEAIFRRYGEKGITECELVNGKALISDDTQMTMFTAEGLLRAKENIIDPSIEDYVKEIYKSYTDWLETQTWEYKAEIVSKHSKLLNTKEMYALRAPGNTCLAALESGRCGSFELKLNNSKGCGGVMRVAPIALLLAPDSTISTKTIDIISARSAAITHSHELGYIPAAFLTHIISEILRGSNLYNAIKSAQNAMSELFDRNENVDYFAQLIDKAVELATNDCEEDDLDAIRELGQGWVAEETVAIAVYCSLKYQDDFEKAIIASVNHSGDSDSTGAVTGNIIGAIVGYSNIPSKFVENLELKGELEDLAKALAPSMPKGSVKNHSTLTIPIGISDDAKISEIVLGRGCGTNGGNGYMIYTPDATLSLNYTIENAYNKYTANELNITVLHCEAYYNIPINCVNESVEYHQVKTFCDLYNKLCLVKDDIENRMDMMQKAGVRELDKYQEIAEENRFPQIIIAINELFHLTDNRDKQNKEEEEYERLCLNLLKEFSRWGALVGVYFLFVFRYACYPYLMRSLEHFSSSVYFKHYSGEVEYHNDNIARAVKNLQKNEILIMPNRLQNAFVVCKMFEL